MWLMGLVVVIVFAIYIVRTETSLARFSGPESLSGSNSEVDQSRYATARTLAALAATPQEQQFAVAALRDADHDLDQSFATAIRHAGIDRQNLSGEALEVAKRIDELNKAIKSDEFNISSLQSAVPANLETATDPNSVEVNGQRLRLAQAQLALDNDELDNAQLDLARLGGNKQSELQRAFDQHRAIEPQAASLPNNTATSELENSRALGTLVGKARIYRSLVQREKALGRANEDVAKTLSSLALQRKQLDNTPDDVVTTTPTSPTPAITSGHDRSTQIANLEYRSNQQKDKSDLDRRIRDLGQLQTVYGDWKKLVAKQRETIATNIVGDLLSIIMALLGIFVLSGLIQYFIRKWEARSGQRFAHTRVILSLILQILVALKILIVIFGIPAQPTTLIGFVTAGLTIALRDYLLSIFGWFGLMGKKGIRVGDWVEIDGTQGEVIEISTLRTTLLETGNWATAGHPTGRQAVFMNKFPFEHKYFNFSTSEQFMWDQISILVPSGNQPSPETVALIHRLVQDETRVDTAMAEAAWNRLSRIHEIQDFGATPPVVVRSSAAGIELIIRYIVRAPARFETSVRLRDQIPSILGLGALTTQPPTQNTAAETISTTS